jgi:phosphoribosylaminoimidazole-succinocarboxamide synthase
MSVNTSGTLPNCLSETSFSFPGQTSFYRGKVRDVYTVDDRLLVMVASDRISAFDVVLPRPIPFKGQVLNQLAANMLAATSDIVPNWVLDVPDPNVTIGVRCSAQPVEMVIRGYLAGHAWREYAAGRRTVCGVSLPDGLRENDRLPEPVITPTTKAAEGHDEDISREEILSRGLVSEADYLRMEEYTRALYRRGSELAARRGLILVDTKYEFGKSGDRVILIDEIHTPDSSRYFYSEGYEDRQREGVPQKQLSKEFVRRWLMENGFQGKEGQSVPVMSDAWLEEISGRYIDLYEQLLGESFKRQDTSEMSGRILRNVTASLERLRQSQ